MMDCLILYSFNLADSQFGTIGIKIIKHAKCIHKFFGGIVLDNLSTKHKLHANLKESLKFRNSNALH